MVLITFILKFYWTTCFPGVFEKPGDKFFHCCNTTGKKTGCGGSCSDMSVASGFSSPSDLR